METTTSENQKNIAVAIHLSTFAKFFFPFGNFIAPIILWTSNKKSNFIDQNGKEAINFQLSIFVYSLIIVMLCIPLIIIFATSFISLMEEISNTDGISLYDLKNISGYVIIFFVATISLFGLFVFELYAVISAAIAASKGKSYNYPLSIPFIKTTIQDQEIDLEINQS